jgi:hypothetical protein
VEVAFGAFYFWHSFTARLFTSSFLLFKRREITNFIQPYIGAGIVAAGPSLHFVLFCFSKEEVLGRSALWTTVVLV